MVSSIATSPAIDLSRLPPPDIIAQPDFEARFAAKLARLRSLYEEFTALVESDPAFKLLEGDSYDEMILVQAFADGARQNLIAFASGGNLDHLAAFYGIERQIIIPADILAGDPGLIEGDADFRERILLAPHGFSVAGPERAYVSFARNAHPDVLDASATSPAPDDIKKLVHDILIAHAAAPALIAAMEAALNAATWPCEVIVSVLSRIANGIASPAALAAVVAALGDDVRPMTDLVTVQSAQIIGFNVTANLFLYAGPDAALMLQEARNSLNAFLDRNRRLGRDVPRSAIIAALHVSGIQRVELISPAADIALTSLQAAVANDIILNNAGIAD
jgi:phage-related baseplate assembly protein